MKGVIYCRVSSKEQIEGTSLESQESACREFAQSKNIEILKVFIEEGESAKFADRTQLLELIDFCRKNNGLVNVLLVWKVDRFARNVADHFSVKATLGKCGVQIMSVTEPIDTKPEGKLMETILAGFAQFDNDIRAMRTVQGMRRKLREGISPWHPPLGYRSPVTAREKKNLPDLPDEPAFSLLKRAFAEFATGAYTQAGMNRLMNSWGLVAARGRAIAPQSLFGLFTNPYYAGILVDPWSGEELPGKHPPLVTKEDFARVQRVISARRRPVRHQRVREEFPLRGFVRCDVCREPLTAGFSRGRSGRYPYYLCHHKHCARRGKSIRTTKIHAEFASLLDEVTPRRELIREIGESVLRMAEDSVKTNLVLRQQRRKRVAQVESQVNELIRMRTQNLITNDEFLVQKKRLANQRMALEAQAGEVASQARVQADLEHIIEPLARLRDTWEALELPFQVRFNRLILPGGFLIGRSRTADKGLLFSVFGTSATMNSGKVPLAFAKLNPLIAEISEFRGILCGAGSSDEDANWVVQRAA